MKINTQELVQSYVLTTAKYDFSIYEKRILYKLIEVAQADLKGKKLNSNYSISKTLFDDRVLTMPLKDFMSEKDQNYTRVKQALTDLRNKTLEYDDGDEWRLIGIIEKPNFRRQKGFVRFEVQPMIWEAVLNFSKGYSKYELETAMSFESVYAMRFYELFSNNKKPLTFTIEQLKERFKIEDKYKNRPSDFVKRVIISAKIELDKKSPYSFEYSLIKTGKKITAIKFFPYEISENKRDDVIEKKAQLKLSSSWVLPRKIVKALKEKFGFTEKGIRANIKLFEDAYYKIDLVAFLSSISRKASAANNPQAYIISSLRKYIKNKENKEFRNEKIKNSINELAKNFNAKK